MSPAIVRLCIGLAILLHLAALGAYWYHPRWWVKRDVRDFNVNPADDTFHGKFHRQRGTWRLAFIVTVALVASIPLTVLAVHFNSWKLAGVEGLLTAGLIVLGLGYFFYYFNPNLNLARKLAYVPEYYVSPDPSASWMPDRYIWNQAVAAWPALAGHDPDYLIRLRQETAANLLKKLLNKVLWSSVTVYAACGITSGILLILYLFSPSPHMTQILDKYHALRSEINALESDVVKAEQNGNKAAATRVRKAMSNMRKTGQEIRKELLDAEKQKKQA